MNIRIDKYLADMGMGSRTEIKNDIRKGLVLCNGSKVKSPNDKIDTEKDIVLYKGEEVKYYEYEYFLLNKPAGVISATEDNRSKTVLDLITDNNRKDLFPVGRLDKDTEGLLLITNDGALAHELLSPKKHVDKTYYVETDSRLTEEHVKIFAEGVRVDEEFVALSAVLLINEAKDSGSKALLTIHEGKFHQVKRMMEAVGNTVTYLKRISMGPLVLPEDLGIGEYRRLSEEEISLLKGIDNV